MRIGIEPVYVAGLAGSPAAEAEGDFAEPSYFPHREWGIFRGDLEDHIVSLAGFAYELFRRQFPFYEVSIYWLNYFFHNCKQSL